MQLGAYLLFYVAANVAAHTPEVPKWIDGRTHIGHDISDVPDRSQALAPPVFLFIS